MLFLYHSKNVNGFVFFAILFINRFHIQSFKCELPAAGLPQSGSYLYAVVSFID